MLPRDVKHCLSQKHNQQHLHQHGAMDVFGEGHGHGVAAHTGNGGQKVAEDAESQQQLDGELDKERVGKRVVENLQVAVHHHQAGGKQQPAHGITFTARAESARSVSRRASRLTFLVCSTDKTSDSNSTPPTKVMAQNK